MRIRKRFHHPCLSSFPTSDPQLNQSPMGHQNLLQTTNKVCPHGNLGVQPGQTEFQPSNSPNQHVMVESENPKWVSSYAKDLDGEEQDGKSNDTLRGSLGPDRGTGRLPPSGSHQVVKRCYEEGKLVPSKKPRGVRTKMTLKSEDMEAKERKESIGNSITCSDESMQKSKKSREIMEGSRCSRVNGRGWRCSQQTLVGYSLCEHHLGKGRLRFITRIAPHNHNHNNVEILSPCSLGNEKQEEKILLGDESNEDDEKNVMVVNKKRMKLGVVKARSMKSLLGQTNN